MNRLAAETSPYLLQHAGNPVDWLPWGPEAFEEAERRDVPIFLSVGYSSCHWCHVMAHESFEDDAVAEKLNERFVPVKVDREERPDVDAVYMDAVQALTGRGGWPMSVFLTPDARPFFGGTYWPKDDRGGMPGFRRVLDSVWDAWTERRDEVVESAGEISAAIDRRSRKAAEGDVDPGVADRAAGLALRAWDRQLGGFGRAPKFPQAMTLDWLVDRAVRTGDGTWLDPVLHSLDAMAAGGIHDQVAGGFHRYSTDAHWLVPHFEKMLYDNALLAPVYAAAAAVTGHARLDRVARSILDYLVREMRHEAGGFYSATDADSEGVEGLFFVWTAEEFREVVGEVGADPERYARYFGVTEDGNWTPERSEPDVAGTNILHVAEPDAVDDLDELDRVRRALHERRSGRVAPGLDDKVLTSWNALAVRAFARCGALLGLPELVDTAVETARFLHEELVVDGRLHHVWKEGTTTVPAFLEDVAYLAVACLDLYAVTGDLDWFQRAERWAGEAVERFHDDDNGGFFSTASDAEELYTRPKDSWDNATPSANSVMGEVALRLAGYTGEARWRDLADEIVGLFAGDAERAPTGFGWFLRTCEGQLAGPREIAIVGEPGRVRDALVDEVWRQPLPGAVIAVTEPGAPATDAIPLLAARTPVDGRPAAYVCREFACERPVTTADDLRELLLEA
ncbi:MAG: thioredoxin domain-containing protein [Actinobacteria bacterium]|nr:thioredoxin domain-containing protein [Actinomycetota bacterium]